MISLDKRLEKEVDRCIKVHCETQKRIGYMGTAAYLIGSKQDDDIHVAHIAVCPLPETADDEAGDMCSRMVDAEWIGEHGTRVVRFLPGGVSIVGLLWLADKKLAVPSRHMLIEALARINRHSNAISSLGLRPPDNKLAIVSIETPLGRPQGYIVDCGRKGADGWQTKVNFQQLDWIPLESTACVNLSVPITEPSLTSNFERQFVGAIREWAQDLLSTEAVLIDGRIREGSETLRTSNKKSRTSAPVKPVQVDTFVSAGGKNGWEGADKQYSYCVVDLSVDVWVRAAVPSKATVQTAVNAVKEHIIRTLCSRAELHYESTDVVEDEQKDRVSVHQLPRIACTPLPSQPAIIFNDFLFEGDSKGEAQESFNDYLNLTVTPDEIEDDSERHLGDSDLAVIGQSEEGTRRVHRSSSSTSSRNSTVGSRARDPFSSSSDISTNYMVLVSVMVALIAIAVYVLFKSLGE